MRLISFTVLCLYVQAQHGDHLDVSEPLPDSEGKRFALGRRGPDLQICEGDDCQEANQRINFKLSRLAEVSASDVEIAHRFVDLEAIQFDWSAPTTITMKDKNGDTFSPTQLQILRNVSLHNSNANDIVLNFTALFMPKRVEMLMHPKGNLTVEVPPHALKFYLGITNWPFLSVNNSLRFVGKVKCKPRRGSEHRPPQAGGDDKPRPSPGPGDKVQRAHEKRFKLDEDGNQHLDSPTAVLIDGQIVENVVRMGQDPKEHEMAFLWTFPYFKHSLSYDPTVAMASSPSSQNPTSASKSASPSSPFLFIVMVILPFFLV